MWRCVFEMCTFLCVTLICSSFDNGVLYLSNWCAFFFTDFDAFADYLLRSLYRSPLFLKNTDATWNPWGKLTTNAKMKHENHLTKKKKIAEKRRKKVLRCVFTGFKFIFCFLCHSFRRAKVLSSFCLNTPIFNSKHDLWRNERCLWSTTTGVFEQEKKSYLINSHLHPFSDAICRQSKWNEGRKMRALRTIPFRYCGRYYYCFYCCCCHGWPWQLLLLGIFLLLLSHSLLLYWCFCR